MQYKYNTNNASINSIALTTQDTSSATESGHGACAKAATLSSRTSSTIKFANLYKKSYGYTITSYENPG